MQDIHAHLYWKSFDEDRDQVLERAKEVGITEMIVVGTSIEENKAVLELTSRYKELFASVGIHPNVFREPITEDWLPLLTEQAEQNNVIAIGECGLDYSESHGSITKAQKAAQNAGFLAQLNLATQKNLPVIIHCRATSATTDDAYWDLVTILKEHVGMLPAVILHCYMGSVAVTKEFLQLENVYFSFTGNITYPMKKELSGGNFDLGEAVKIIPPNRLFVETDCPFLAPQTKRGKRNEPAFVVETARKIAELKNTSLTEIERQTTENFQQIFSILR